tara:strand:+ start:992 stop:2485 length:1494 start_codon:yes stop_codon:yes gene_type:complete
MNISVNALNQEIYNIPEDLNDLNGIEGFLSNQAGKKIIVVQGLGFVGAVMSLVCANAITEEYAVIGVDLANEESYWKIKSINNGIFPLIADDPKIDEFFENTKLKGNFYATCDPTAYSYADIIIVDINLDVQKTSSEHCTLMDFDVDMNGFEAAMTVIGQNCRENALILVETTVPPGTCENLVKPAIKRELEKRNLSFDQISLGHSYERVMPGPEYIDSIRCFPRVYSGIDDNSADIIESFLKTIIDIDQCQLTRLGHTNASEMAKVLENSYRATNIAFAVEWSRFAEEAGVDLYAIVDAIRVRKTHANLMFPGIGVGGYCLTKDPLLASWARKSYFKSTESLEMSINSVSINDQMPIFAYKRLVEVFGSIENKNIVFLGVSYRGDVGDTRYSPVEPLFVNILKVGANIRLHDPFVSFWGEQNIYIESNIDDVLSSNPDLIILSTGHSIYRDEMVINKILDVPATNIFDTIGLFNKIQLKALQKKHKVSVLGRGDIL